MSGIELISITNDPNIALICEQSGVGIVMVDLETEGKEERQAGRDTLISYHSLDDIYSIKKIIGQSSLLVRINPLSARTPCEVDAVLSSGADAIMLPMADDYRTVSEFSDIVSGRAKKVLLLETIPALIRASQLCRKDVVDEVHIGLNDMHIDARLNFMFELMTSHVLESLCSLLKDRGIPFGIGGVAPISQVNKLPAELIIAQHARLGSNRVIMSRGFKEILSESNPLESMAAEVSSLKNEYSRALRFSEMEIKQKTAQFTKLVAEIAKV